MRFSPARSSLFVLGAFAAAAMVACSDSSAPAPEPLVIVGPVYPPPGGVTFEASGSSGIGSGRMQVYKGLDLTATRYLAFGVDGSAASAPGLAFDGNLDPDERMVVDMAASNPSGGMMRWTGSTSVPQVDAPNIVVPTRLTLTMATGPAGSEVPVALTATAGTQLPSSSGWVAVITSNADFRMNVLFEAFYNDAWGPALTVFDAIPMKVSGVQSQTSINTGFFYSL